MHPIEVRDLRVTYGPTVAVDSATFVVGQGEIVALLGPNGAGKTSTLEVLEGYRLAEAGTATILGTSVTDRPTVAERIGVLLQHDGIYPAAKPLDIVRLFWRLYGKKGPHPTQLIAELGLESRAKTPVRRLSGGEKRRLGLALALAGAPEVLLLDEPTSGVDHAGRQLLRRILAAARDKGTAILLTTHELDEAQRLADRIIILDKGGVVAEGTPDELTKATSASGIRFSAEAGLDLTYLVVVLGAQIVEVEPGEYHVSTTPTPSALAKITAWMAERQIMLGEVRAGRHRLEDVFEQLTSPPPSADAGLSNRRRRR